MKIDFVINNLGAGGGERVLSIIANELVERDHDITVTTLKNRQEIPDAFKLLERVKRVKLVKKRTGNYTITNFLNLFFHYRKRTNRPDVLVAFMTETALITIIVAKLLNIKSVVSEHTNHLNEHNYDGFIRKYVYRFANSVVVLTDFDLAFYRKNRSNPITIPNPSPFTSSKASEKRHKVLLALGNLNKHHVKGFDNLILAAAPVLKKQADWELHIYGKVDQESHSVLHDIVEEQDLLQQIHFKGYCSDVQKIMTEGEIFVLSSRREGLPMVLIEAMSQGMACIAFDCVTGPSDIIENNTNGLLVENQNIDKLSAGINKLITDDELRKRFQMEGPKSIERFQPHRVVDLWEDLLHSI